MKEDRENSTVEIWEKVHILKNKWKQIQKENWFVLKEKDNGDPLKR